MLLQTDMLSSVTVISPDSMWKLELSSCHLSIKTVIRADDNELKLVETLHITHFLIRICRYSYYIKQKGESIRNDRYK
jgi:hypothetical protein